MECLPSAFLNIISEWPPNPFCKFDPVCFFKKFSSNQCGALTNLLGDSPRIATPPVDLGGAKLGLGTVGILRGWFDARDVAKSTGWLCSGIWGPPPGPTLPGGGGYPPWVLPWFDINARWISGEINNFILSKIIFLLSKFLKSSVILFTFWTDFLSICFDPW